MAIRNQPYFPLYTQDFISDEKLRECSASSVGVYIFLMCVFHKSEQYGAITLNAKDKKSEDNIANFALKLSKHLPFDKETIGEAVSELLDTGVLSLDGDTLFQKRMVHDGEISDIRATARKKRDQKNGCNNFVPDFVPTKCGTKSEQNTEYEDEDENENENDIDSVNDNSPEDRGTGEETSSSSQSGDLTPPVYTLPLVDKTSFAVTEAQFNKWAEMYPAVDVLQELRKMDGWLESNPKKRKTKNGIMRFINGWLAREQDRGGNRKRDPPLPAYGSAPGKYHSPPRSYSEVAAEMAAQMGGIRRDG